MEKGVLARGVRQRKSAHERCVRMMSNVFGPLQRELVVARAAGGGAMALYGGVVAVVALADPVRLKEQGRGARLRRWRRRRGNGNVIAAGGMAVACGEERAHSEKRDDGEQRDGQNAHDLSASFSA